MLYVIKRSVRGVLRGIINVPIIYTVIQIVSFSFSIIIRLSTGGTHIIYNALGGRGIFPSAAWYLIFYSIRLFLCGVILAFVFYYARIYKDCIRPVAPAVIACLFLVCEYKLIFGGVSLVLAIAASLLIPLLLFISLSKSYRKSKSIFIMYIVLTFLQLLFFVQLISLSVCI